MQNIATAVAINDHLSFLDSQVHELCGEIGRLRAAGVDPSIIAEYEAELAVVAAEIEKNEEAFDALFA